MERESKAGTGRPPAAGLRHAGILRKLQQTPQDSPQWLMLAASYSALILADRWREGEDPANLTVALASVDDTIRAIGGVVPDVVDPSGLHTLRRSLACAGPFPESRESITHALLEWCEICWRRLELDLALSVAHVALDCAPNASVGLSRAHLHAGIAHRLLGELADADRHYTACVEVAEAIGDSEGVFRGRLGVAKVIVARGNLPRAESLLSDLVAWAVSAEQFDLESRAHHELGVTLGLRARFDDALEHLNAALRLCQPVDRDRILADIAYTHLQAGNLRPARDLYLQVIQGALDSWTRAAAQVSLLEIDAALGDRAALEAGRRILEQASLPATFEIDFRITLGRAYLALGSFDAAQRSLERAVSLSRQSGMGQFLIRADEALEELQKARSAAPVRVPAEPLQRPNSRAERGHALHTKNVGSGSE